MGYLRLSLFFFSKLQIMHSKSKMKLLSLMKRSAFFFFLFSQNKALFQSIIQCTLYMCMLKCIVLQGPPGPPGLPGEKVRLFNTNVKSICLFILHTRSLKFWKLMVLKVVWDFFILQDLFLCLNEHNKERFLQLFKKYLSSPVISLDQISSNYSIL